MDPIRWREIKTMFQKAIDVPECDRKAFVDSQCPTDIREDVILLLESHQNNSGFLESRFGSPASHPTPDGNILSVDGEEKRIDGRVVEDFQIVRRIGQGGMGTVYAARQKNPDREVAIKVLNSATDTSKKVLRRFREEAEILARMRHPGIAHVYTSGNHDFGNGLQPWFAMELIHGKPLNEYVQVRKPDKTHSLRLLLKICDAIQHAHQRGVIHRDLKPANILIVGESPDLETPNKQADTVSSHHRKKSSADVPAIKIVDFGVARILDTNRQRTQLTSSGEILGTLNYMSPEQVASDPTTVDQQSDVYALGAIGFELVTGESPFDRQTGSLARTIKSIEKAEPILMGEVDVSLRGDLELVFGKALANDRQVRYQSVTEFADDIRRYLSCEPIRARPPSAFYRCLKFVSRHRALVAGTLATIIALSTGLTIALLQAREARSAAGKSRYGEEKATAINNFIINDFMTKFMSAANENRTETDRIQVVGLVDHAASKIREMFGERPAIEAAVRNEVASIYYNLGAFEQAVNQFESALHLWRLELGENHPDTLKAVNNLGLCYWQLGRLDEAGKLFRQALSGRLQVLGERDPFTLVSMNNLALVLRSGPDTEEPLRLLRRALELQKEVLGVEHKETLTTTLNLSLVLKQSGDLQRAIELQQTVYETSCRVLGEHHVTSLTAGQRLAHSFCSSKANENAIPVIQSVIEGNQKLNGPSHSDTIASRRLFAKILLANGDRESALQQLNIAESALLADETPCEEQLSLVRRDKKPFADGSRSDR